MLAINTLYLRHTNIIIITIIVIIIIMYNEYFQSQTTPFLCMNLHDLSRKIKAIRNKTVCTKSIVCSFFNCWYCMLMIVCYENLLYVEENERVQFSFNSQTAVPRLISTLWEREGNLMLNEKKRDGRGKNPFPLIWYGNISCSHTHNGYENKWLGGWRRLWGRGEMGSPERCSACCFLEKERIDEGGRVEMEEAKIYGRCEKKVNRRTLSCMLTFCLVLTTSEVCEGVRHLVVSVRVRSLGILCQ